jgi:DeoR family ulaG and ulaABCDEF operon transcriptional repressor
LTGHGACASESDNDQYRGNDKGYAPAPARRNPPRSAHHARLPLNCRPHGVDGDAIIINGGTTTVQMAEFLRHTRLKILTNSYPLAEFLIRETQNRVALPGGEVYREQKIIVAPFDDDAIQHYSARIMFMSAISIGPLGVIEGDPLIARAETKLLRRADKLVVLADASKFTQRGSLVVCPLPRVHAVITDRAAPPEALAMLRDAGVQTIVVDLETRVTEAA